MQGRSNNRKSNWYFTVVYNVKLSGSGCMTKNRSAGIIEMALHNDARPTQVCTFSTVSTRNWIRSNSDMAALYQVCLSQLQGVSECPCLLAKMREKLIWKWAWNMKSMPWKTVRCYRPSRPWRRTSPHKKHSNPSSQKSVTIHPRKKRAGHKRVFSPHQSSQK